jgi:hypothetical protein
LTVLAEAVVVVVAAAVVLLISIDFWLKSIVVTVLKIQRFVNYVVARDFSGSEMMHFVVWRNVG